MHFRFKILLVWVIVLSIFYSTLSIVRHNHFQSGGFDLGIYDQAVWQYSRFQWPYNTIKDRFILGDHLTLTLPLLAPLYWLWEDVRILLAFQAFWVSLSALAVYRIAIVRLMKKEGLDSRLRGNDNKRSEDDNKGSGGDRNNEIVALCLAVTYSLFPGIQYAVFFDFHPVMIGVGLLPWIAYFLESNHKKLLWSAVTLLLLTQENMGLALAGLGLIYVFQKSYRRTAITFIIMGIVSSVAAMKMIAALSPSGFDYQPVLPNNPVGFVTQLFDSPEKRQSWFMSLAWFSFLPILSPGALLAVVLDLSQYFVTGPAFVRMWSPFAHHRAILAPFLVLGTLGALGWLERIRRIRGIEIIAAILLFSVFAQQYMFHYPLNKLTKGEFWKEEAWMRDTRALLRLVPPDASVAAQQSIVPHLSHRKEIYLVYPVLHDYNDVRCGTRQCWWLDFSVKAEYLAVDLHPNQWITQMLETNEHFGEAVANMEKAGSIKRMHAIGASRLYTVASGDGIIKKL